jgi:pyruvate/2-oxoglutarate dehydrogenase complex dihydrolipoamide acyltransferase (E2) component
MIYLSVDIVTVNLDALGESIKTGVVVSWNKEPGDAVKEDDVIAVIETDKVNCLLYFLLLFLII